MPKFKKKRASNKSPSPSPKRSIDEKPEKRIDGVRGRNDPVTVIDKAAELLYQETMKKRNQKHAISNSIKRGKQLIDALACKEIKTQSTMI